jgi:hypothetical protein
VSALTDSSVAAAVVSDAAEEAVMESSLELSESFLLLQAAISPRATTIETSARPAGRRGGVCRI